MPAPHLRQNQICGSGRSGPAVAVTWKETGTGPTGRWGGRTESAGWPKLPLAWRGLPANRLSSMSLS